MITDDIKTAASELVEHARNGNVFQQIKMDDGSVQQRHLPNCLSPHYERLVYEIIWRVVLKVIDDAGKEVDASVEKLLRDEATAVEHLSFARDTFLRRTRAIMASKKTYAPFAVGNEVDSAKP